MIESNVKSVSIAASYFLWALMQYPLLLFMTLSAFHCGRLPALGNLHHS